MASALQRQGHSYKDIRAAPNAALHLGDVVYQGDVHYHSYDNTGGALVQDTSRETVFEPAPHEISNYDADFVLATQLERHLSGTCIWLREEPIFQEWLYGTSSTLYVTGSVGCGKTLLAASTIRHLQRLDRQYTSATIHFFIDETTGCGTDLVHIIRALIRQLWQALLEKPSTAIRSLAARLRSDLHIHRAATPAGVLIDILVQLVRAFGFVKVVVDGLDRLAEADINWFVEVVQSLIQQCDKQLRVLCFCRDVLGRGIRPYVTSERSQHIQIQLSHIQSDIELFIDHEIEHLQAMRPITNNTQLVGEVKSVLKENNNKMFLWIYFQLQNIWSPDFTTCDDDIREQLQDLPEGLDQTYIRCLHRIERNCKGQSRDIAHKAFKWIASCKLPMTSRQLSEAVSIDPENLPLRAERLINIPVPEYCANLLLTQTTTDTVHFAHDTIVKFLHESSRLPDTLRKYGLDREADDLWCGEICMAYCRYLLTLRQLVPRRTVKASISIKSLLANQLPDLMSPRLLGRTAELLAKKTIREVKLPIPALALSQSATHTDLRFHHYLRIGWLTHSRFVCRDASLMAQFEHLCLSNDSILHPWINKHTSTSQHRQRLFEHAAANDHIPLFLTVLHDIRRNKSEKTISEMLCQLSPDSGQTLLHLAASRGSLEMVKLLLEYVDVNVRDASGMNVIARAAHSHQHQVLSYLLSHPLADDISAHEYKCGSMDGQFRQRLGHSCLLSVCASVGNLEGIKLIQRLRRTDSEQFLKIRFYWEEALFAACWHGHENVARYVMNTASLDPSTFTCISAALRRQINGSPFELAIDEKCWPFLRLILDLGGRPQDVRSEHCHIYIKTISLRPPDALDGIELYVKYGIRPTPHRNNFLGRSCMDYLVPLLTRTWFRFTEVSLGMGNSRWRDGLKIVNRMAKLVVENVHPAEPAAYLPTFDLTREVGGNFRVLQRDGNYRIEVRSFGWLAGASDEVLLLFLKYGWLQFLWQEALRCDQPAYYQNESYGQNTALVILQFLANRRSPRVLHAFVNREAQPIFKEDTSEIWSSSQNRLVQELCESTLLGTTRQVFDQDGVISDYRNNTPFSDPSASEMTLAYRSKWFRSILVRAHSEFLAHEDYSLNFPFGYEFFDRGWQIRIQIKISIYLWNWRLRRRRRKSMSDADIELLRLLFEGNLRRLRVDLSNISEHSNI